MPSPDADRPDTTTSRTYAVTGMSCEHCVAAVTQAVGALDGVEAVAVDLAAGSVRVDGTGVSDDAVRAAVAEEGYEVVT